MLCPWAPAPSLVVQIYCQRTRKRTMRKRTTTEAAKVTYSAGGMRPVQFGVVLSVLLVFILREGAGAGPGRVGEEMNSCTQANADRQ